MITNPHISDYKSNDRGILYIIIVIFITLFVVVEAFACDKPDCNFVDLTCDDIKYLLYIQNATPKVAKQKTCHLVLYYLTYIKPESANGSFAIRERESIEWEVRFGMSYTGMTFEVIRELENENHYWGYWVNGKQVIKYNLTVETELRQVQAVNIDRQTAMIGKRFGKNQGYGVLAGVATQRWRNADDAYTFEIPLPYGHIRHVTDFTRKVSIWSSEFKYALQLANAPSWEPYIKGSYLGDNEKTTWRIKIGVECLL